MTGWPGGGLQPLRPSHRQLLALHFEGQVTGPPVTSGQLRKPLCPTYKRRLSTLLDEKELPPVRAAGLHTKDNQVAGRQDPEVGGQQQLSQGAVSCQGTCKEEAVTHPSPTQQPWPGGSTWQRSWCSKEPTGSHRLACLGRQAPPLAQSKSTPSEPQTPALALAPSTLTLLPFLGSRLDVGQPHV